jgi:TRAP-type C4-dicarboxylate transport system permease small subunit
MRYLDTFCAGLAVFSGIILVALIGLTFFDVILRYIFSAPIFGARDLLEMGMVVVISLAFPFTWRAGGHIVVDLVPDYGLKALTVTRDVTVRLIGGIIFGLLSWRAWIRSDDAVLFTEATNMIELPFSPFFIVLAIGSALQVIVLSVEICRLLSGASLAHTIPWTDMQEDASPSN